MEPRTPTNDDVHTPSPVEEEVRALVRASPRAGWERVVQVWNERLYVHAWCILKDPSDARDVVQEVFLRAMREPRFFAPEFRMQAWLYRVTRNLCFNLVRDRRRREGILAAAARSEAFDADPIERVFEEERHDELAAALATLTPDHRAILLLRYYDDLSYAEIAEVLALKLGTVMSRLSRARDRLLEVVREQRNALLAS